MNGPKVSPWSSAMCVPLVNRGQLLGVLNISASSERENVTMTAALSLPRTKRVWVTDDANRVVLDGYLG